MKNYSKDMVDELDKFAKRKEAIGVTIVLVVIVVLLIITLSL